MSFQRAAIYRHDGQTIDHIWCVASGPKTKPEIATVIRINVAIENVA
jgi:hypothetical protein